MSYLSPSLLFIQLAFLLGIYHLFYKKAKILKKIALIATIIALFIHPGFYSLLPNIALAENSSFLWIYIIYFMLSGGFKKTPLQDIILAILATLISLLFIHDLIEVFKQIHWINNFTLALLFHSALLFGLSLHFILKSYYNPWSLLDVILLYSYTLTITALASPFILISNLILVFFIHIAVKNKIIFISNIYVLIGLFLSSISWSFILNKL